MPIVYLLRHCEYDNPRNILAGRLPLELSVQGRQRAQELQQYFADKKIAKIYSSAVMRCKQTAEIIANQKIPILYDQRILETLSAYQGYWGESQTDKGFEFFLHREKLGGEGLADIQNRMVDFWKEIRTNLQENIIICSHGDPLMVLYRHINNLGLPHDNVTENNLVGWLEKGECIEVEL